MPTPPLPDDVLREAWQVYVAHEYCNLSAANSLGINPKTFASRIHVAKSRGLHLSEGAAGIVQAAKLAPVEAKGGWVHSYDDDGKKIGATRWAPVEGQADPGEWLDAIKAGLADIEPAKDLPKPERVQADLMNVWPFFDVHWGMHAWRKETLGPDYDLKLARDDMMRAVENLVWVAPHAQEAVVIFGGDTFHADDTRSETPASKHKLDVDGRHFRVVEELIGTLVRVVYRLLSFHENVTIRVMRGNHDPHSHLILTFALAAYFKADRVNVVKDPSDLFMQQWGRCGIFAHHGDRIAKPVDLALKLADVCPFWSEAKHRHAYTGHMHKMEAQRVGGLQWERVEPFAPADGYGSSWVNRRGLKVDTYHKWRGRIGSVYDPLERD